MKRMITEKLADFTEITTFSSIPADVVEESKRLILDSIGCAIAGVGEPKGEIGIKFSQTLGQNDPAATIIGTGKRASIFGAAFANGELINALDMDAVLPPGHVSPYVMPVIFAVGEEQKASGQAIIESVALSHEMSFRIGKAMDYLRDIKDGKADPPPVYGYSSTIFGATATAAKLRGLSSEKIAHAIGIAASIAPVQSQVAWFQHAPSSTIKYLMAGALTQSALTASFMAELGHRGDLQILDDAEFGYRRFIGTRRWDADRITDDLGQKWLFTPFSTIKPYPHCRILHSLLDCEINLIKEHNIKPDEIEAIKVYVEGFVEQPVWLNTHIEQLHDAQFSIAHGIAIGALGLQPGKAWQDPKIVFSEQTLALMNKVTHEIHPDYVKHLLENPSSKPAKIEIKARGKVFIGETLFPKGVRSPDPKTYMSNDELIEKFLHNASSQLTTSRAKKVVDMVMNLEDVKDFSLVMKNLAADL